MTNNCLHCGLKTSYDEQFCCIGCEFAYNMINKLGLGNYYKNRLIKQGEKPLRPEENNIVDIKEFVTKDENGINSAYLMVEGLHCAACIWLIESILKKQENVKTARINMSNRKLHLQWYGDQELCKVEEKTKDSKGVAIEGAKRKSHKPSFCASPNSKDIKYGNKLVKLITDLGYKLTPFDIEILKSEEKKYDNKLLMALGVSGFAAGNIMLLSVALWSSNVETMGLTTRNLLHFFAALIALPTIIYCGRVFFLSAFKALKARTTNMDVPISVAIILVTIISIYETFNDAEHIYFDSAVMLIFFLLIGRYLDFSARRKAMSVSTDLMMLSGSTATIIDDKGKNKVIAVKNIKKGMTLLIASGEKIAADGVIIEGNSEIDTSLISGESIPRSCKVGNAVFAGTINMGAPIKVKVDKSKDNTLLAEIVRLTENLEQYKGKYLSMADKVAGYYTPIVHIIAFLTFILWYFVLKIDPKLALLNATAVLIITCPCALALAAPVVQIIAASKLMKKGIILKTSAALENLSQVKAVIFDKTGTLTIGRPTLSLKDSKMSNTSLRIAASVAAKSKHPLSKGLCTSYKGDIIDLKVKETAGMGLISEYKGKEIKLGKKEFVIGDQAYNYDEFEGSKIFMKYGDEISLFCFEDIKREDSNQVISDLKAMGKKVILLSGDNEKAVTKMAQEIGIEECYYDKTPIEKCDLLKIFKDKYQNILMVGDGLNDAPSLSLAGVSISPSKASDITKNAADIIFQGEKLSPILQSLLIAKKSRILMKQNFAFAFIYNLIAVPFAIMGYIVPLFAALAMSSSSIIVVLNSLRLKSQ